MAEKREDHSQPPAPEIFVDRDPWRRTFENAVYAIPTDESIIRTWYGAGGQGKSALCRELYRISSEEVEPSYAHLRRALINLHDRSKTDPVLLLVWIRNGFAQAGVSFPAFDLALAIAWEKTYGEKEFPKLERPWLFRTSETLLEAAPDAIEMTREFFEEEVRTIPLLGYLLGKSMHWGLDRGKAAWIRKVRPQMNAFYREGVLIEDHEIWARMPWMLAQDLNRHLEDHPRDRFVLFIDEYEGLIEGAGTGARWRENKFDSHMRKLISETNGMLALFFTREKLPWEEDSAWKDDLAGHQHRLGGLADRDAQDWLMRVPISDPEIRAAIIDGARETSAAASPVYPLMLDLQIQNWRELGDTATPADFTVAAATFEGRRNELVQRLLRSYPDDIQLAITRLAVVQRFDRTAFEHVVKTFNIPLDLSAFDRLADLSLLSQGDDGWLTLHRTIADAIVEASDTRLIQSAREALLAHFTGRANPECPADVTDETLVCLTEAARLRLRSGITGYVDWLDEAGLQIHRARKIAFVEGLWNEALETCLEDLGPDHPDTATSYYNIAGNLETQGRSVEAEPFYHKALEIFERALGTDHEHTAASWNSLAINLQAQGRFVEARSLFRKALDVYERVFGRNDPRYGTVRINLAMNLDAQGRFGEAEPLLCRELEIRERALGPNHLFIAWSCNNLAMNLNAQGRSVEAEPLLRRALKICGRVLGPNHPNTAASAGNLASILDALGRPAEAEPLHRRAKDIWKRTLGADNAYSAIAAARLAGCLATLDRMLEAEALICEADKTAAALTSLPEYWSGRVRLAWAKGLSRAGLHEEAGNEARKALMFLKDAHGPTARYIAQAEELLRKSGGA